MLRELDVGIQLRTGGCAGARVPMRRSGVLPVISRRAFLDRLG